MKPILWIFSILLSQCCSAKVAYIPLFDNNLAKEIQESYVMAVDLDNGRVLKRILVGEGVGAIFINQAEDNIYASASEENKIVQIDARTLEISKQWMNLPIKPEQVMLTPNESKLIFTEYGHDNIYQLDLNTGAINLALSISGFISFLYSENLEFIVFRSRDSISGDYQLHTYSTDPLSLLYQTDSFDGRHIQIDNSGENYYYFLPLSSRFRSSSLIDNRLNWEFRESNTEIFRSAHFIDSDQILITGLDEGSYIVNANSGDGQRINQLTATYNSVYERVENSMQFLQSNLPTISFSTLPPHEIYYGPLKLTLQNHSNGTERLIYERPNSANLARGRYIGGNLFQVQSVPFLSIWSLVLLLFSFIYMAIKNIYYQMKRRPSNFKT